MSRKIAKTLLPHDVEQYVFDTYIGSLYSYKVKQIYTWCNALNIKPTKQHVTWDDNMWRMGTQLGDKWEKQRNSIKPKEAKKITFDRPTLIKCEACDTNMVHVKLIIQKRGCDEPKTCYCVCKNPKCKEKLGHENKFKIEA